MLSEFVVKSEKDSGYGASNAYTATRIGIPIAKTPLNIQVVTAQLIEDQGVHDFQGMLRFTSGVNGDSLNRDAGTVNLLGSGSFNIRGFVPNVFLRNGFRRPNNLVMDNAERVEIVKGPASVFFGQAAPGGLINVITRKPLGQFAASVDYTYGDYNYNKARFDVSTPLGKTAGFRLFVSREDSDDWRDYVYSRSTVVAPTLSWRVNDRLQLNFDYEYVDKRFNFPPYTAIGNRRYMADYAAPPAAAIAKLGMTADQLQARWRTSINTWIADVTTVTGVAPFRITDYITDLSPRGLNYNPGGPDQVNSHKTQSFTVEANYRLNDAISFRYGGNYYELEKHDLQAGLAVVNADRTINLGLSNPNESDRWWIHQFDVLLKHDLSFVKSKFVVGWQFTKDRDINTPGLFDNNSAPGGAATITAHNAYTMPDIRLSQIAVTQQAATGANNATNYTRGYAASWYGEWFESGRLTTLIGARYEDDIRERLGGSPVLPDLRRHATVPTFGATFQLVDGYSLFASYSENFAPNSSRSITGPGVVDADNAHDLPVELGKGMDFGLKADWMQNRLSGSLSLYQVDRTNVPRSDYAANVSDPRNAGGLSTPTSVQYTVAGGLERTQGAELDLVYQPSRSYQLLVSGAWMWKSEVVRDPSLAPGTINYDRTFNQGRRLRNTPEWTGAVWNKYSFTGAPLKGLELGFGLRYVGEEEPRATDVTTSLKNPAFTVANALIGYKTHFDRHPLYLSLNVDNLFDRVYYEGNTMVSDPRKVYFKVRMDY
ncbi:MAG: hypothetical protein JWM32_2761 [Verrucomicrobia bacterium]|nr:hypothetical protein [Verrucomicrobiota bacterium]